MTTPTTELLTERDITACLAEASCIGTVKMSFESGPYDIDRPSINATRFAEAVQRALLARLGEQQTAGIGMAAQWVRQRQIDFIEQQGCTDPETGALSFGRGPHAEAKHEYVCELDEIIEGIEGLAKCDVPPAGWTCTRTKGHAGPCAAHPPAAQPVAQGEREAFEAWVTAAQGPRDAAMVLPRDDLTSGDYYSPTTRAMWEAWQARASRSSAQGAAQVPPGMTAAVRDVLAERERQVVIEGFDARHDDENQHEEMAFAAACYVTADEGEAPPAVWPWGLKWWKPKGRRTNLVKAAALSIAEIERLDRAAAHSTTKEQGNVA